MHQSCLDSCISIAGVPTQRNVLDEVELGDAIAHGAQHAVAIGCEKHIALCVHGATQVLELRTIRATTRIETSVEPPRNSERHGLCGTVPQVAHVLGRQTS